MEYKVTLDPEEVDNLVRDNLMECIRNMDQGWDIFDDPHLEDAMMTVLRYYTTPAEYVAFCKLRKSRPTITIR